MKKPIRIPAHVQPIFDRFWAAYPAPLDNPKKPAARVFADLLAAGVDGEALVQAAGAFAAHVRKNRIERQFIPHARTWLNQERYEDWIKDVPASAPATGPSPEHPLACLQAEVGPGPWASYFAPATVERTAAGVRLVAATAYARNKLRDEWGRQIVAVLGPVTWAVRGEGSAR